MNPLHQYVSSKGPQVLKSIVTSFLFHPLYLPRIKWRE